MARPITFLSDYGLADEFVGVVHAVIAKECPEARVIDLTHGIARHGVLAGALVLARALPFAPAGVHLAVVDPEVGARRRAIALRTHDEERYLVGPDNGLLMPAAERFGGVYEAVEITASPWRLQPVSATFHGRDIFAPVAARLAAGEPLADAGMPLAPDELVPLELPTAKREGDALRAPVLAVDSFGNVQLAVTHEEAAQLGLRIGESVSVESDGAQHEARIARTFADVSRGTLVLYEDAARMLALAVNLGDAAELLGARPGDEVVLRWR